MIPDYIIEQMDSEQQKCIAHTENFMETIKHAPFSESIKDRMLAALRCTVSLLQENERDRNLLQEAMTLLDANQRDAAWLKQVNKLKQKICYNND